MTDTTEQAAIGNRCLTTVRGSKETKSHHLRPVQAIRSLNQIIEWRGKPFSIRMDNGPEYVSGKLMEWAKKQGITLSHIQPGKPQQNAYIERYNRTVRHEWLDQYIIESIEEAQEFATKWLWTYNNERPNMGIGRITPAQKLKMAEKILLLNPVKNGGITLRLSHMDLLHITCGD